MPSAKLSSGTESRTQEGGRWIWGRGRLERTSPGLSLLPAASEANLLFPFLHLVSCIFLPGKGHRAGSAFLAWPNLAFLGRRVLGCAWSVLRPGWLLGALSPRLLIWELDGGFLGCDR